MTATPPQLAHYRSHPAALSSFQSGLLTLISCNRWLANKCKKSEKILKGGAS